MRTIWRALSSLASLWSRGDRGGYRPAMSRADEHLKLDQAFTECAGAWVAIDRRTGTVVASRATPYELSAYIKSNRIGGVDILRAPSLDEPEVVGIG